ncbi:MAG: aminotransferase class V-fold PLP-dependent enzyme [Desulfuromusa sp.]|jgi:cysteine desulfurase/selenocysteine lyase|nr:aminotransferase class V-fold PLP-dependent enzyme [Desulfuromusa sp.]
MTLTKPIYLDNAATSHPKPEAVYLAVMEALRAGGSPGRGSHRSAMAAEHLVFETREALAELFNAASSDRFIFTHNATTAINQALFGLLRPGDRVVTTTVEHNAVTRPLRELQERGVAIVKVAADPVTGIVKSSALQEACLCQPTRLLLVNHCSNVFGSIQPIEGLGRWCHDHGILFMLDGAQSAGSVPIDFQALNIDLFAAPGHKGLLGPQGTGFLYVNEGIELVPLIYGGTGANSHSDRQPQIFPECLESGTLNLPGLAGLSAALQFLQQTGIEQLRTRELELIEKICTGLKNIESVKLYGSDDVMLRAGAISFNLTNYDPAEVGFILDQQEQISARVGLHCAPDAHRTIGTYPTGTVRVSPGYFTTEAEIDHFLQTIEKLNDKKLKS